MGYHVNLFCDMVFAVVVSRLPREGACMLLTVLSNTIKEKNQQFFKHKTVVLKFAFAFLLNNYKN